MEQRFGFTDLKDKDQKYQVENSVTVASTFTSGLKTMTLVFSFSLDH